jgi:hypothetical protein
VASPPLRDADNSLYFFRITDTDPSRQPASIDEVRDQVVKDLRRKVAYERLKTSLATIETQARTSGLLDTALAHGAVVQAPMPVYLWNEFWVGAMIQYNMPMQANPSTLPIIGAERSAIEAILAKASTLPTDKPVTDLPAAERTFAVPVDEKLAVLVFEITGVTPLSAESFERLAQSGAIQRLVAADESDPQKTLAAAFSFDALAKRHRFVLDRGEEDASTTGEAPKADPPKTAAAG